MEKLQLNHLDCSIPEPTPLPSVGNGPSRFQSVPPSLLSEEQTGDKLNKTTVALLLGRIILARLFL